MASKIVASSVGCVPSTSIASNPHSQWAALLALRMIEQSGKLPFVHSDHIIAGNQAQ
jgi:hypothetical protein